MMIGKDKNCTLRDGIRLSKKKDPLAVKIFTDLLEKESKPEAKASYYWHRGNAYYYLEMYEEAIDDYTKAIGERSSAGLEPLAAPFHNRGNAYYMLGNYRKAIKDYTREIELNPDYPEARKMRYKAMVELRRRSWLEWTRYHKCRVIVGAIFVIVGGGFLLSYMKSANFLDSLNPLLITGLILISAGLLSFKFRIGVGLPFLKIEPPKLKEQMA